MVSLVLEVGERRGPREGTWGDKRPYLQGLRKEDRNPESLDLLKNGCEGVKEAGTRRSFLGPKELRQQVADGRDSWHHNHHAERPHSAFPLPSERPQPPQSMG